MSTGISIPFQFVPAMAQDKINATKSQADFLVTVMGITNTAGRVVVGLAVYWIPVHPLIILGVGLMLGGIVTVLNHLYQTYALLVTYSALHGVVFGKFMYIRNSFYQFYLRSYLS